MRCVSAALIALSMAAAPPRAAAATTTPRDAFLIAVRNITGKPVLWHPWQPEFERLRIPRSRRDLKRALASSPFRLIEDRHWAYLVRGEIIYPYAKDTPSWMRIRARHFALTTRALNLHAEGDDALTEKQLAHFSDRFLHGARLVPVRNTDADPAADDGQLSLELLFMQFAMPDEKRGVVALVRADSDAEVARLVVGDDERLLWDSPLVPARAADLLLTDVDGDAIVEIVLRARTNERPERDFVSVFDLTGREMTRQASCEAFSREDLGPPEGFACAITGEEVLLHRRDGRVEILSTSKGVESRYVLYRGRFVRSRPAS